VYAYINIIGGLWLDEPAADLAAVIALASSYLDRPVPSELVAVGEVGLTGRTAHRQPSGAAVSPRSSAWASKVRGSGASGGQSGGISGLQLIPARNIGEAIRAALRPSE